MRQALTALITAATLAGCGARREPPAVDRVQRPADWRAVATPADRERLRQWRSVWLDAVSRARASGAGREMVAQGVLFDPDKALPDPVPPAGDYRCRVFRLGAKTPTMRDYVAYPAQSCRVEEQGTRSTIRTTGGAQRPVGQMYPIPAGRAVFLGTLLLGDERQPIAYGRDAVRDMAGFVDRIGPSRWRLALPLPAFGSTLDVIELVPAQSR
jgi:hypothetical protein